VDIIIIIIIIITATTAAAAAAAMLLLLVLFYIVMEFSFETFVLASREFACSRNAVFEYTGLEEIWVGGGDE
jgi:hypothetical protein